MRISDAQPIPSRANVLLVDDVPANLLALHATLEPLGQNLVDALSGTEALRRLLEQDFAVILLDIRMTEMDGFETAQLIRSRERSRCVPIIFVTAYDDGSLSAEKAYSLGAVDYLVQPIAPNILRAKVEGFVELFRKTEQIREQGERLLALERRLAETAIRESEARYCAIIETTPECVKLIGTDGSLLQMNPAGLAMIEADAEGVLGQCMYNFVAPEHLSAYQQHHQRVCKGERGSLMYEMIGLKGTRRHVETTAVPLTADDGTISHLAITRDISEGMRSEAALRRSEERFRQLADSMPQIVWTAGPDGSIDYSNQRWHDYSCSFVGKEGWRDLVHPDDLPTVMETWADCLQQLTPFEMEVRLLDKRNGKHHWHLMRVLPVRTPGANIRWYGTATDISRQKHVEQELKETEQRLKAVFNQQFQFMAILAPDGVLIDANDTCFRVTGVRREEALGRPFWEASWWSQSPGLQKWWQDRIREVLATGNPANGHAAFSLADGSLREGEVVVTALKDTAGKVTRILVEGRDDTERRQQESALRVSEQRWRTLAEALPNLVWTSSPDGQCDWMSTQWRKFTGIPEEELLGLRWLETVVHPEDRARTLTSWRAACEDRGDFDVELRIPQHDGEYHWFKTRGAPIRDETGKIIYWFGTCTDIEDSKRLEAALRDADRKKDDFLAVLAHELRNPLAPLCNGLQLMRLAANDPAAITRTQDMMERQLGHMVRLIDDLLDISRITRNKMKLRKSRVLLEDVITNAVETARPLIDAAEHQFALSLPPEPVLLNADLTRLAQVFGNLLSNSAKYTARGGHIWLKANVHDGHVIISVHDNGIGIPPDSVNTIFNMFSQVDRSLERSTGGLGIGLALVKGLVEMHEGNVIAESSGVAKGSVFTVRLPVLQSNPTAAPERTAQERQTAAMSKARILVVDDNRDAAASMAAMLQYNGNEVRTAHDGIEALEVAESFQPGVVLMDLGMPKLNGYEAAMRIREQSWGKSLTLIAMTGWGQEHDRLRSHQAGFDHHLVKPVDLVALEDLVVRSRTPTV